MKPFLLVTGDFVKTGGMDRANYALADYLARHGHEVHLVAHRVAPELLAQPSVHFHQVWKPAGSYLLGEPLLAAAGQKWAKQISAAGGHVLVNGGNCPWPDLNWVHYVHAAYQRKASGNWLRRTRIAAVHRWDSRHERQRVPAARVVISNSNVTRQHLIEQVQVPANRIHTVYYGTDCQELAPITTAERTAMRSTLQLPPDIPVAVFVGALGDQRKAFDTVWQAWQKLCLDPQWQGQLLVLGHGRELAHWQTATAAAGLTERIRFLGFRRDVPQVLAACDVLVHPARYEAYGLSVHEAVCRGLPALVSASAGVAERIPAAGQSLLLQNPDDAVELQMRLQDWWQQRMALAPVVATWGATLRSVSWDDMARQIVNLATQSTAERGGS